MKNPISPEDVCIFDTPRILPFCSIEAEPLLNAARGIPFDASPPGIDYVPEEQSDRVFVRAAALFVLLLLATAIGFAAGQLFQQMRGSV